MFTSLYMAMNTSLSLGNVVKILSGVRDKSGILCVVKG